MHNILNRLKMKSVEYVGPTHNYLEGVASFEKDGHNEELSKLVEKRIKMFDDLNGMASVRVIKSHLPAFLLPIQIWTIQPKVIYISRDAKDVAISWYRMCCSQLIPYTGTMDKFFHDFCHDSLEYGPFYEHIHSFYQLRQRKHLLLLTYEELSVNTFECVKKISDFLDCSYTDEQLYQHMESVSFEKMRENIEYDASKNPDFV